MENKINIAELLKDCPQGMELDCVNYDGTVIFEEVVDCRNYPIKISVKYDNELFTETLTKYGQSCRTPYNKCVIFPKGKTTWEGFVPPCKFKDGDVVTSVFQGAVQGTGIFDYEEQSEAWIHVCINLNNEFSTDGYLGHVYNLRLATEEEKQKLFKAIKDNGYRWNAETKTLEKLPKFKVGNRVRHCRVEGSSIYRVVKIEKSKYVVHKNIGECDYHIDFEVQDDWELVPDKFDITTLKPFESRVLVRDRNNNEWRGQFFSHYDNCSDRPYICIGVEGLCEYKQCIPYEANKELLSTTNDCDDYYKTWE